MKLVSQLKASRIPKDLGLPDDDPRVLQYFNEFQQDALSHGRWWGTVVTAEFCTFGGLVAWPRNVAAVEQITVCGHTIQGHNLWYRFMDAVAQPPPCSSCHGHGSDHGCGRCGGLVWTEEGNLPVFHQLHAARYVKLYPRSNSDIGKRVLIQGYDKNSEWVRRLDGGIFVDGEYLTLASPFVLSTVQFSAITGVQKDVTDKNVLAYAYDSVSGTEEAIADWQPDEVAPSYKVTRIPHFGKRNGTVHALVKLDHIPVAVDTDWLIIQNEIAIKAGMRSRLLYEQDRDQEADKEFLRAINALNHELRTRNGDRSEMFVDLGTQCLRGDLTGFR